MSANLYDLFDVDETASVDQIRAAWKASIADLDPTDRRFRAFNDAAGVLLDAERRSAYDAELAAKRAAEERAAGEPDEEASTTGADAAERVAVPEARADAGVEPDLRAVGVAPAPAPAADDSRPDDAHARDDTDEGAEDRAGTALAAAPTGDEEPGEAAIAAGENMDDEDTGAEDTESDAELAAVPTGTSGVEPGVSRGPGWWALGAAAVAAVLAVALAAWVIAQPDVKPRGESNAQVTAIASKVGQLVADKIVPAMSYDYRTLPADLKGLQVYMTPSMAAKQAKAWKALSPQAKQQHAVVVSHAPSDAPGSGLTRVSDDGTRAVVLAFIDQDVTKLATAPFSLDMWATFILDKDAKTGAWLVDDICTDRVCS